MSDPIPEPSVDSLLSEMAFSCAGGITEDGRKEYTPTKSQLYKLLVSKAEPNPTTPAGRPKFVSIETLTDLFGEETK